MKFISIVGSPDGICKELKGLPIENEAFTIRVLKSFRQITKYITNFGIPEKNFKMI